MSEELLVELSESVREGAAILKGEQAPSGEFRVEEPDIWDTHSIQPVSSPVCICIKTLQN